MRKKSLPKIFWNIEVWAVQKHVNLVDIVKSSLTNIFLQTSASIKPRTSRSKFADTYLPPTQGDIYRSAVLEPANK